MYKALITTKEIEHIHTVCDYVDVENLICQITYKDKVW